MDDVLDYFLQRIAQAGRTQDWGSIWGLYGEHTIQTQLLFQLVKCNHLNKWNQSYNIQISNNPIIFLRITVSSQSVRPKNGTLGYKRRASLMQHSRYFNSLKSFMETWRSESPKTRSSSSLIRSYIQTIQLSGEKPKTDFIQNYLPVHVGDSLLGVTPNLLQQL